MKRKTQKMKANPTGKGVLIKICYNTHKRKKVQNTQDENIDKSKITPCLKTQGCAH